MLELGQKGSAICHVTSLNFGKQVILYCSKQLETTFTQVGKKNRCISSLSLEFMNLLQNFHIAVIKYLYRGCYVVTLQTFTT